MKITRFNWRRAGYWLVTIVVASAFLGQSTAAAIEDSALKGILHNTPFYSPESDASDTCSTSAGDTTVAAGNLPAAVPEPWNGIVTAAAAKFNTSGPLLAAILYWENRAFPDPNKDWGTSSAGAEGPMQFLPSTWAGYATDGDGDGVADILNNYDAVYGAAKLLSANGVTASSQLGTLDHPGTPGTLLRAAANYNYGGGNVDSAGGDNITLDSLPQETADYVRAVYTLISSNFSSLPLAGGDGTADGGTASSETTSANSDGCAGAALGTGTGNFTDSTTVQIPGASGAVAKAQQLAQAGPSTWQAVCDGSPNCLSRCERLASVIWGRTSSGYETALSHWQAAEAAGTAHPAAGSDGRTPPIGALLFYDTGHPDGHVATYLGNNLVASNDVGDAKSGQTGGVYIVPASDMESTAWHLTYLGWVSPVPW